MAEATLGRLRLGTCVLLGLLLAPPVQAITMTFGDIEITPGPAPKGTSAHGYFEYVFHIVNTSADRPHIVSLSIPYENYVIRGDSLRELRRTVQVGAKETVHLFLLQPDQPPISGRDVAVVIDGRLQDRELPLKPSESLRRYHRGRGIVTYSGTPIEPLILMGGGVKPFPTTAPVPGGPRGGPGMPGGPGGGPGMPGGPGGGPGMPGGPPMSPPHMPPGVRIWPAMLHPGGPDGAMILRMPPEEMLGISLLTPLERIPRMVLAWQMGELEQPPGKPGLPPHGFQFVNADTWSDNWLAYSRYDGILVTAAELNALPAATQTALWQYVETGGALLVLGRTDLRGLSAVTYSRQDEAGWLEVRAGFGICRVSPDANYDAWDADHFAQLMNDWRNTGSWPWGNRDTSSANQDFPIIDDLGIPVRGLFVLMFLFVLGIGPLNIFVLSRLKRRIWLLWTTPVLSLCTCLAVFGYMLISEGWSGRLRSETLTLLDETAHRATTIGWTGVYSPLTPGDGLHFAFETEVIPVRFFEGENGGARSCTIDLGQDQHFASGWVEARIPAHFKVRKSELRRERVTLHRDRDGRWSMVNGLGAAINHFWYADAKGQIHVAEDVAPGARAPLTLTEKECQVKPHAMQSFLFGPNKWELNVQTVLRNPQNYLHPGLYLAEADDSPFLEDALRNARTRKLHTLVVGFGKHAEKGD
jgi:hypothetical protein